MFCLNYYPDTDANYFNDVQELKIKYDLITAPTLMDILQKYSDKTLIIDVADDFNAVDAKLFNGLKEKFNNFKIVIKYENKEEIELAQKNNIPFFFCNFVTTIDQMYGLMNYCPTDMYICEDLGFRLNSIAKILHEHKILLRTFPNICQTSFADTSGLLSFFIRPQDIPIYSNFIDVFELVADNKERQRLIFKIYKQQKWFGNIKEIIPTFKGELDGKYILDNFALFRTNCGKRCLYEPLSCNICTRIIELSQSFEKNNIVLLPK